ncbi:MAG: response regulator transcription factor [Planctomycetota bacterium]
MPVRIVLAEDQPIVRKGIGMLAQAADVEVVAQVNSVDEIAIAVGQFKPDVLVTEVRLGGQDALKSLEHLPENQTPRVIVFSSFGNPTNIARASALGAYEFILKTANEDFLFHAIKAAAEGKSTPDDSLLVTTKTRMRKSSRLSTDSPLTNRETQVLRHVSMGLKNREIGKSLGISVETVKEHVQNILRKLDVNDRTQAAVWAIRNEFI